MKTFRILCIVAVMMLLCGTVHAQWDTMKAVKDSVSATHSNLLDNVSAGSDTASAVHATVKAFESATADTLTDVHTRLAEVQSATADTLTDVHTRLAEVQSATADTLTDVHTIVRQFREEVLDSLYAALDEIRTVDAHHHAKEKWFGRHATQAGDNWALQDTLGAFVATSGDNTWGVDAADTTFVLGSSDTPTAVGYNYFDMHSIFVTTANQTSIYKMRFVWSTTNFADGLAAGNLTEIVFSVASAASRIAPVDLKIPRLASGTKVWAQAWNATDNATISFLIGLHEYDH